MIWPARPRITGGAAGSSGARRRTTPTGGRGIGRAGRCTASAKWSPMPATGVVAGALVVGWGVVGVVVGFPTWWATELYGVTASVTFVMVFVIQHTQSRQVTALQRKLDELDPGDERCRREHLIAVEEAPDEELQALADLNLSDRSEPDPGRPR